MTTRDDLITELDSWSDGGVNATFWWRDDDAVRHTPALHRLFTQSGEHDIPLTLAVVPFGAHKELCTGTDAPRHLRLVQHGYAHINHAPDNEKKSEFGLHRNLGAVVDDISSGLSKLETFLKFIPVFVPPWNRIDSGLCKSLVGAGLSGLSTFGIRQNREPVKGLIQTNAHVDLIDWHGSRGFIGADSVHQQILDHLIARRSQKCDFNEPTGILTHHLVHDDACWDFLDSLFGTLAGHRAVRWLDGVEVFAA